MIKQMGAQFPPKSEIENCCNSNPDGFGAMYVAGGKVKTFKTMDEKVFLQWYDKFVKKHPVSTPLVCHMRIATHGSKRVENCHPWTDARGLVGFAHNGILTIKNRKDMTDSETFFRDIWLPTYAAGGSKAADKATQACIGSSRFAFLFADGHIERWGDWQQGSIKEGVWYTNGSWAPRTYVSYGGYGCYGGRSYWDDDKMDDSWYEKYARRWKKANTEVKAIRNCATLDEAVDWIINNVDYEHILEIRMKYLKNEPDWKQRMTTEELVRMYLKRNTWGCPIGEIWDVYGTYYSKVDETDKTFLKAFCSKYYAHFAPQSSATTVTTVTTTK